MKDASRVDIERCKTLLETRQRGFRVSDMVRRNSRHYVLLVACLFALLMMTGLATGLMQLGAAFGSGMVFGALVRDLGWFRRLRQNWPLSERITDWKEVERIASLRSTDRLSSSD